MGCIGKHVYINEKKYDYTSDTERMQMHDIHIIHVHVHDMTTSSC